MSKPKHVEFKVRMPVIAGVDPAIYEGYIRDAIRSWCGQAVAPRGDEQPDEWWLMGDFTSEFTVTKFRG